MKRVASSLSLLLLLWLLSLPWPLLAQTQGPGTKTSWFSGTPQTLSLAGVTAGQAIAIGVNWATTTSSVSSLACSPTAVDATTDGTTGRQNTYLITNSASGTVNCQITFSADPGGGSAFMDAIGCIATSSALDVHNGAAQTSPGTTTDAVHTPSVTPTASGDFIWAISWNESNNTTNAGTGYTQFEQDTSIGGVTEGKVQAVAAAIQPTFTNAAGFGNNISSVMALKSAGGCTTPCTPTLSFFGVGRCGL